MACTVISRVIPVLAVVLAYCQRFRDSFFRAYLDTIQMTLYHERTKNGLLKGFPTRLNYNIFDIRISTALWVLVFEFVLKGKF